MDLEISMTIYDQDNLIVIAMSKVHRV